MELAQTVYELPSDFPSEERFGMTQQMRRAAVLIPSNIAEGWGRNHYREHFQFVGGVRRSFAELDTRIQLAERLVYIPGDYCVFAKLDFVGKHLAGLYRKWSKV